MSLLNDTLTTAGNDVFDDVTRDGTLNNTGHDVFSDGITNEAWNTTGNDVFDDVTTGVDYEADATEYVTSFPTVGQEDGDSLNFTYFPLSLFMIGVSLVANLLVVVITRFEPKLRTASNRYICSLAAADLCVTITVMVPFMLYNIHDSWPFGAALCTLWVCCDFSLCSVSMLHLCLIAFDRYKAIAQPLSFTKQQRVRRIKREIILTWVIGFCVWSPVVIVFRHALGDADEQEGDCFYLPTRGYVLAQSVLVYYTPMAIMAFIYVLMVRALKAMDLKWTKYVKTKKTVDLEDSVANTSDSLDAVPIQAKGKPAKKSKPVETFSLQTKLENKGYVASEDSGIELRYTSQQTDQMKSPEVFSMAYKPTSRGQYVVNDYLTELSVDGATNDTVGPARTKTAGGHVTQPPAQVLKRKKKHEALTRMIGLVILAFLICWLPFCIFWPVSAFCDTCIPPDVYTMSYWMAYMNSALNPILYFIMNGDFRLGAVHLFQRLCRVKVTCQQPSACDCRCI